MHLLIHSVAFCFLLLTDNLDTPFEYSIADRCFCEFGLCVVVSRSLYLHQMSASRIG